MIAFVRGEVAAVTLTSAVLEVGGVGLELMCTPNTLATLRAGQIADAADVDGRPRGLPDALRLRRRRREAGLRAGADRQRGRPQAGPGDARRPHARRRTPRRRRRRRPHADRRSRASGRRAPSGSSSSSRTGSACRRPSVRVAACPCCRSRGATRCSRAWSGSAGRPRTPTRRSRPSPTRRGRPPTAPTWRRCCVPRSAALSRA